MVVATKLAMFTAGLVLAVGLVWGFAVVGDSAQSSWPVPAESAAARAEALEGKPVHEFHLSTNYRNSAEIYDMAAKVAAIAVPHPDLAEAVRRTGEQPRHLTVSFDELVDTARRSAEEILDRVEGTVAIVAPTARRGLRRRALPPAGNGRRRGALGGLAARDAAGLLPRPMGGRGRAGRASGSPRLPGPR